MRLGIQPQNISLAFLEKILSLDDDLKLKKIRERVEVWDLGLLKDELRRSHLTVLFCVVLLFSVFLYS